MLFPNDPNLKMRKVLAMSEEQMPEWRQIAQAYAKKQNAKLVFVNSTSFGIQYPDGTCSKITIEMLTNILKKEKGET